MRPGRCGGDAGDRQGGRSANKDRGPPEDREGAGRQPKRDKDMKSLIAAVVLAGLPFVAGADEIATVAQCAGVAERFGSAARALTISELDQLKTCITLQVEAMGRDTLQQQRPQVAVTKRYAKPFLRDDL